MDVLERLGKVGIVSPSLEYAMVLIWEYLLGIPSCLFDRYQFTSSSSHPVVLGVTVRSHEGSSSQGSPITLPMELLVA